MTKRVSKSQNFFEKDAKHSLRKVKSLLYSTLLLVKPQLDIPALLIFFRALLLKEVFVKKSVFHDSMWDESNDFTLTVLYFSVPLNRPPFLFQRSERT